MQLTEAKVAVVGAGLIGHGMALDFAAHGHQVWLYGRGAARLQHAEERIARLLQILQESDQLTDEQAQAALARGADGDSACRGGRRRGSGDRGRLRRPDAETRRIWRVGTAVPPA